MRSSVIEMLAENAMKNPEKLCLADERKAMTYVQVWDSVCGLAMELEKKGLSKGKCIVVECNQSVDYMMFEFAAHLLKGIFVPVEKNAARSRIVEIITDTDAVLFVSEKHYEGLLQECMDEISGSGNESCVNAADLQMMDINSADKFAFGADNDERPYVAPVRELDIIGFPEKDDVSEILFSTGTTGKSKGIVLTHGNDVAIAENVCTGVKMKPENVEMIPMPTSHSHGLRRTYANMCNGSAVVFVDGIMFMKKVYKMIEEYHVTSMDLSPSMLSIIFKLSKDRLGDYADTMDYIQLGSAPLPEDDKIHLSSILPKTRLYNFYGSTEAGCSCLLDFNEMSGKPGCIGKPAVNAHFIVVDEDRNEINSSIDNTGFLASSGAINMKEYFKAPELTKEAMPDGDYIYTKDIGYIDEEGLVYMLGRKDDVINFGGVKISPEEIESVVSKHKWIKDCACVPVKDALTGQAPKLFIALEENASESFDLKDFKTFLTEALDANKQPKFIEQIDEIPRTFNGKIIRKKLIPEQQ